MEDHELHPGLEHRLLALANRIAALRRKMNKAKGAEKIEALGRINNLERRYRKQAARLQALNREGPGFLQEVRAELAKVADDLSGAVDEFITRIESEYRGEQPKKRASKR